jgi:hypothetical protein
MGALFLKSHVKISRFRYTKVFHRKKVTGRTSYAGNCCRFVTKSSISLNLLVWMRMFSFFDNIIKGLAIPFLFVSKGQPEAKMRIFFY